MILKVGGMHCGSCEKLLKMVIEDAVPGAKVVKADHGRGLLEVDADAADVPAIKKAIAAEGYEVVD